MKASIKPGILFIALLFLTFNVNRCLADHTQKQGGAATATDSSLNEEVQRPLVAFLPSYIFKN